MCIGYSSITAFFALHCIGKGTSKNQCSQTFCGPNPASEPEVKHTQDFIMSKKDNIKLFLTFHSYSQVQIP